MKLHLFANQGQSLLWPAALGLLLASSPTFAPSFSPAGGECRAQTAPPAAESKPAEVTPDARKPAAKPATDAAATPPAEKEATPAAGEESRVAWFEQYMSGAKLVGRFTVVGKPNDEMPEEEYTIVKVEKLPEGDLYRFTARIRYGETDTELPMDLPVLWAGDTPVISLTNLWIPGLGTFSSRVMIYRGRYAGTWTHGAVGGHLFGVIEKEEPAAEK